MINTFSSLYWPFKILFMNIITAISVFVILSLLAIYLFRRFVPENKNIARVLFSEALKNENDGYFETALINYGKALEAVKKSRFYRSSLESKIVAKLKILQTVIAYKNGIYTGR